MNPIVLYFASGESLYSGAALLLLLLALTPLVRKRWFAALRVPLVGVSLALMVLACPPFPFWLDGIFLAALVAWLVAWTRADQPATAARRRFRLYANVGLTLLALLLPALELPWRQAPRLVGTPSDHLVVIGDSISAGLDVEPPWPRVLQDRTGIPVINLAVGGAETSDALAQCRKLAPDDTLVLIEIGGNDLLGGVPAAEFASRLDTLLAACAAPKRTVIMFELPLLPHRIGYGRVQRRLAGRYHVPLIPKRYFAEVFAAGTSDGLHLAPAGARRMAEVVYSLLNPELIRPAAARVTPPQTAR
jgi:acyl-CoA thioesterase-1